MPRGGPPCPSDVVLAVKGGRFITHMKALRDVETPLANFFASGRAGARAAARAGALAAAASASASTADRLARFFELLPRTTAEAAAARRRGTTTSSPEDRSPHDVRGRRAGAARARAAARRASTPTRRGALCASTAWRSSSPTAPGAWPRHGRRDERLPLRAAARRDRALRERLHRTRPSTGGPQTCRDWLAEGHDVHVYFDNDAKGHAPLRRGAARPAARAAHRRVSEERVPIGAQRGRPPGIRCRDETRTTGASHDRAATGATRDEPRRAARGAGAAQGALPRGPGRGACTRSRRAPSSANRSPSRCPPRRARCAPDCTRPRAATAPTPARATC